MNLNGHVAKVTICPTSENNVWAGVDGLGVIYGTDTTIIIIIIIIILIFSPRYRRIVHLKRTSADLLLCHPSCIIRGMHRRRFFLLSQ